MGWLITRLAQETSVYTDDVWVADSSPVECACTNAEEVLIQIQYRPPALSLVTCSFLTLGR
jgi:hypothetical protein